MNKQSTPAKQNPFEKGFEWLLWNSRFCVLLAVIFGILGAVSLFVIGSYEIFNVIVHTFPIDPHKQKLGHIVIEVIGAIDLYLIGIVILLFSFGIYELFISKIDIGQKNKDLKILEITTLDQLKNKLMKVIVMVLVVSFFKHVLDMDYNTPLQLMYLALSIFAISLGIYFLNKRAYS